MTPSLFPVIMAGGPGTRLWPESRRACPKPFLPLLPGGRSLLRATLERIAPLAAPESTFVVSGKYFSELTRLSVPELPSERVLLEPSARDTAPCVAWAALEAIRLDPEAILLVLASDHLIEPDVEFQTSIRRAVALVESEPSAIATLGIEPTFPATGYGYIERGESLSAELDVYRVARFREKPDFETASKFISDGRFFWNAGIFVWKAKTYLNALKRFEPDFNKTLDVLADRIDDARRNGGRPEEDPIFIDAFNCAKKISVDYAVLERYENVCVLPARDFSWNDLGSFDALEVLDRAGNIDPEANIVVGAECVAENARGNYARLRKADGAKKKMLVLADVDDLLVVETEDAIVITKKSSSQVLKNVVKRLMDEGRDEFL